MTLAHFIFVCWIVMLYMILFFPIIFWDYCLLRFQAFAEFDLLVKHIFAEYLDLLSCPGTLVAVGYRELLFFFYAFIMDVSRRHLVR